VKSFDGKDNAAFYATVSRKERSNFSSQIGTSVNCTLHELKIGQKRFAIKTFVTKQAGEKQ
jgi:hypothetical protein